MRYLIAAGFFVTFQASAAEPRSVAIAGTCERLVMAGKATQCPPSLVYARLDNERTVLSFSLGGDRIGAFIADTENRPRPTAAYFYLSRVRIAGKNINSVSNIAGQCLAQFSNDGKYWQRVDCNATDENGAAYTLAFKAESLTAGQNVVSAVAARFKSIYQKSGMLAISADVQKCYNDSENDKAAQKLCFLYDATAFQLDQGMIEYFTSQGVPDAQPATSYMSPKAFNARKDIYISLAFDGSKERADLFVGNSPNEVLALGLKN